jgi:amino acid permease
MIHLTECWTSQLFPIAGGFAHYAARFVDPSLVGLS